MKNDLINVLRYLKEFYKMEINQLVENIHKVERLESDIAEVLNLSIDDLYDFRATFKNDIIYDDLEKVADNIIKYYKI